MADDDEPPLMADFGEVTIERLEKGVEQAAYIVETCGDEYIPIFERLSRELAQARRVEAAYHRAMTYPVDPARK